MAQIFFRCSQCGKADQFFQCPSCQNTDYFTLPGNGAQCSCGFLIQQGLCACGVAVPEAGFYEQAQIKQAEPTPETKSCPFCAETIKFSAVKCRFCGSDLAEEKKTVSGPSGKVIGAAVLSFLWALAVLGISFLQFDFGQTELASWNMMIAGLYIVIGILLLRMVPAGRSWGLWSNVVNVALAVIYAVEWGATVFLFLLPIEIAIIICLALSSGEFGGKKHLEAKAGDEL